jgi:hypothetical protein
VENVRSYPNFPGQLRVSPWAFTTMPELSRLLSTPWYTEREFTAIQAILI